ncbi:NAD(P)H-dependent glycerol-3-phosphate dehydrogenase [Rurimicrobium arvi]|uniref:Glycerol-3-phosphate dehydrogenase n=1 Tax=Rurimicrobium arvi TaxID=2049916 RepID=A0ABP8MS43_9BACT
MSQSIVTDTKRNIGIIGNGSWGTALAKILTDNGNAVHWWLRNEESVRYLNEHQQNQHYLKSVKFRKGSVLPTSSLEAFFASCDYIIFCVPAAYAQSVLDRITADMLKGKQLISAIKGILPSSNLLLNDYLHRELGFPLQDYISITGPCHAEEVAAERLSYLTFSCIDESRAALVASFFTNTYLRTTFNHDIWGAQLAAVLKNIYALGAGIAHGLDYGDNFLSVYITNCYREMHRFLLVHFDLVHPSEDRPDMHTSAYLGDLLVTAYSLHSRNRAFGMMIGKGYSVAAASLEMSMVAEGYYASKCMQSVADTLGLDIPIATYIYRILWKGEEPAAVFRNIEELLS